jgi:hypothetical protein
MKCLPSKRSLKCLSMADAGSKGRTLKLKQIFSLAKATRGSGIESNVCSPELVLHSTSNWRLDRCRMYRERHTRDISSLKQDLKQDVVLIPPADNETKCYETELTSSVRS